MLDAPPRTYRSQTNIGDGYVVLETPWPLNPDDLADLEEWVGLCLKVIRRVSERSWQPEVHPLAVWQFVGVPVHLVETFVSPACSIALARNDRR